jgi:hypothetical protein
MFFVRVLDSPGVAGQARLVYKGAVGATKLTLILLV